MIPPTKYALLSVSDKSGIVEFAEILSRNGYLLLSTGGTAALLRENQIKHTEVAEHTGFPEIMGGRVKTLHPKIHGGILCRRQQDQQVMQEHQIAPIDIVVVNLYPFAQTIARTDCTLDDAIENIDIGGPAMLRSAAKNHNAVCVVTDPEDYARVASALQSDQGVSGALRFELAMKAFALTAAYDQMIATYLADQLDSEASKTSSDSYPEHLNLQFEKKIELRYGENPHQSAAFYVDAGAAGFASGSVSSASQLQGKALSYNNIADTDAALQCVKEFADPACVIVKHANPCGVAQADTILCAYDLAWQTDPTSAFGGIIAFNQQVDAVTAQTIVERQFVEVVIAPSISADAAQVFAQKAQIRVLACGDIADNASALHFARVEGGLLVQQQDDQLYLPENLKVVTRLQPSKENMSDVEFAFKVVKYVKSNAIVYCLDGRTVGIGAGQMSRVYSAKLAVLKANDENLSVRGSVMASDAFFPFRDGVDAAAEAGVSVIVQPGGSKNDGEVIAAADEHKIAMVFTGMRHFRH